jgi:hypothetical protein
MMRVRVPIAALMGVVLLIALGCAALRSGSALWASILLTVDFVLLGFASLAIAYRRGARRAWWVGFAVFGWGYLGLAFGPWTAENVAPRLATTAFLDAMFYRLGATPRSYEPAPLGVASENPGVFVRNAISSQNSNSLNLAQNSATWAFRFRDQLTPEELSQLFEHRRLLDDKDRSVLEAERAASLLARFGGRDEFVQVGHALSTILAACLGGLFGVVLRATQGPRERGEERNAIVADVGP